MVFKKYEFASEQEADSYINQLPTSVDEDGNNYANHSHNIKKLGFLIITSATYNEEGQELTPNVINDKYSVDILWDQETAEPYLTDWANKEVTNGGTWRNNNGAHTWYGFDFG